jgi:hypothetical protein
MVIRSVLKAAMISALTSHFASMVTFLFFFSFSLISHSETLDVRMQSTRGNEGSAFEPEPLKKSSDDSIFIEDYEAQVRDSKDAIVNLEKDIRVLRKRMADVKARNYRSSKNFQKQILASLETKRRALTQRLSVLRQQLIADQEILEIQKRRLRYRERMQNAEEAIDQAKISLADKKHEHIILLAQRKAYASNKKAKKVKVEFHEDSKPKTKRLADAI